MGKIHLLWYGNPERRPWGCRKAAPPGISVVREGIMVSHPSAKVQAERLGGRAREISKHGNVYLKFRLK